MLIATQTPDFEDPPSLNAVTTSLAGPIGGTLFKTFGNPILLHRLWPEVRQRIADTLHQYRTRAELEQKVGELAVEIYLERLIRAGDDPAWQRDLAPKSREVRRRLLERCKAQGGHYAGRLLLYCAHPDFSPEERLVLLLDLFLGCDGSETLLARRSGFRGAAARGVLALEVAQERHCKLSALGAAEIQGRMPLLMELLRDLYHLELASGPSRIPAGKQLGRLALWALDWVHENLPFNERLQALRAEIMLLEARQRTRWDFLGRPIHLSEQERIRWNLGLMRDAESILRSLSRSTRSSREGLRARIQQVLMDATCWEETDWPLLAFLYRDLEARTGVAGVGVGLAEAQAGLSPKAALLALEGSRLRLADARYLAMRGTLLARLGEVRHALRDLRRAFERTPLWSCRLALRKQIEGLEELQSNLGWGEPEVARVE